MRQLAAIRFYLQRMLVRSGNSWHARARRITNYLALLDQIRHHAATSSPACFVTFNYDRLLELALPEVGVQIRGLDDYISSREIKVIKLHGSVDWMHTIETEIAAVRDGSGARETRIVDEIIERAPDISIRADYRLVESPRVVDAPAPAGPALFPAIAIPVIRKQQFECPDSHVGALREFLPSVRKVLIVGWRGTEAPFLELLREHMHSNASTVAVCGGIESGSETLEHLVAAGVPLEPREAVARGFTEFMQHDAERFLAAKL
jgi:hypothetical protein